MCGFDWARVGLIAKLKNWGVEEGTLIYVLVRGLCIMKGFSRVTKRGMFLARSLLGSYPIAIIRVSTLNRLALSL